MNVFRGIENVLNVPFSIKARCQKKQFVSCGTNVIVGKYCSFIPSHIHCGSHVIIGEGCSLVASVTHIYIGSYVLIGPRTTIRGGDHRTDIIGKHIFEIGPSEKLPENDADVHIEDGVWIGCNSTILKGVTLGKGSIVAAGSVVVKDVPPYAVVGGVPAKVIKYRFTEEQICEHERILKQRKV